MEIRDRAIALFILGIIILAGLITIFYWVVMTICNLLF